MNKTKKKSEWTICKCEKPDMVWELRGNFCDRCGGKIVPKKTSWEREFLSRYTSPPGASISPTASEKDWKEKCFWTELHSVDKVLNFIRKVRQEAYQGGVEIEKYAKELVVSVGKELLGDDWTKERLKEISALKKRE